MSFLVLAVRWADAPVPDPSVLPPEVGHVATAYGPWAIIGFTVYAILSGRLVPRQVHRDMVAERDFYRQAYREERSQRDAAVTGAQQTAVAVTQALPPHPAAEPPAPGVRLL